MKNLETPGKTGRVGRYAYDIRVGWITVYHGASRDVLARLIRNVTVVLLALAIVTGLSIVSPAGKITPGQPFFSISASLQVAWHFFAKAT